MSERIGLAPLASPALAFPPPLRPGDCVAVVAPASPFGAESFERGVAWLRERFRVKVPEGILSRQGYLAGDDRRRACELSAAMTDPDVKVIAVARGGYGVLRIVDELPWEAFARAPKWIVGFSDVTALHACAWARGVASIHGPNVTGLGEDARTNEAWLGAVCGQVPAPRWEGLRVVSAGAGAAAEVRGPIAGGNLSLVQAMAASGRLELPAGCILALEDVTERPYRVDRMLTALRLGGHLTRAAAVVFGSFDQCDPGPDGVHVEDVLAERTRDLGVPVLVGAPFGHGAVNDAFVLGASVQVTASAEGTVAFRLDGSRVDAGQSPSTLLVS